jgi:hypothetical protein
MNNTDFVAGGMDPAIQARVNDMYDPAHPGLALAGSWGLEQIVADGEDFRAAAPLDQWRIRAIRFDTDGVGVERLFSFRQQNWDVPADQRPPSGLSGAFAPQFWQLADVEDVRPGLTRTAEYALGGVFRLDDDRAIGHVTRLCIEWDERSTSDPDDGWVPRTECGALDWVLCREEAESASCTTAAEERAARTGS